MPHRVDDVRRPSIGEPAHHEMHIATTKPSHGRRPPPPILPAVAEPRRRPNACCRAARFSTPFDDNPEVVAVGPFRRLEERRILLRVVDAIADRSVQ
jgi:hypothetical protein